MKPKKDKARAIVQHGMRLAIDDIVSRFNGGVRTYRWPRSEGRPSYVPDRWRYMDRQERKPAPVRPKRRSWHLPAYGCHFPVYPVSSEAWGG